MEFCRVKWCSSGLFRICNPIISLRHFYSIFAWICIEICGLIIWLVARKNTQYQALSAFYGEIRRYETGRFALDTKFHIAYFLYLYLYLTTSLYYIIFSFSSLLVILHCKIFTLSWLRRGRWPVSSS